MRKELAWKGLDAVAPQVPKLRRRALRALLDGDPKLLRDALLPRLLERERFEQNADPDYLHDRSFGFQIQHKSRERLYKLLGVHDTIVVRSEHTLGDAELLALVEELGLRRLDVTPAHIPHAALQAPDSGERSEHGILGENPAAGAVAAGGATPPEAGDPQPRGSARPALSPRPDIPQQRGAS